MALIISEALEKENDQSELHSNYHRFDLTGVILFNKGNKSPELYFADLLIDFVILFLLSNKGTRQNNHFDAAISGPLRFCMTATNDLYSCYLIRQLCNIQAATNSLNTPGNLGT